MATKKKINYGEGIAVSQIDVEIRKALDAISEELMNSIYDPDHYKNMKVKKLFEKQLTDILEDGDRDV